jgi:chorismate mutase
METKKRTRDESMNQSTQNGVQPLQRRRDEIDRLDSQLLRLLNQRARIACELGAIKIASGLAAYDGRRERQVLARMCAENEGPLGPENVANIFRRIILETRRIGIRSMQQQRVKSAAVKNLSKEARNGH